MAVDSLVSGGCIISGSYIRRSLLFSKVRVNGYCTLENAVVLPGCEIERHVRLNKVILDKGCRIPEGTVIGEDPEEDSKRFYRTPEGVVLVTRKMLDQEGPYPSYY